MMTNRIPVYLPLWILAMLITACGSVPERIAKEKFSQIARSYELSITWSEFEAAATHLKPESDDAEPPDFEQLKNIEVSRYRIKRVALSNDREEITQVVEIEYFHKDKMIVKTIVNTQIWKYDAQLKRWFLTNGLPDFK